jgi:alkanesulfonate monooxygenase SsuD/methylene tetrahydromethanopterin reductase-like flavin-dependent oxidoreductase (luciferase family)
VYASLAGLGPHESYEWYRQRLASEGMKQRSLSELVARHSAIVGGPERCAESIRWYEEQGVDTMILLVQAGSLRHDDICESLRRFGKEVIPRFRS